MPLSGHVFFFNMRVVQHLKNGNCYLIYNPNFKEVLIGKCRYNSTLDLTWGVTITSDKYTKITITDLLEEYDDCLIDVTDTNDIFFKLTNDEILQHVVLDRI